MFAGPNGSGKSTLKSVINPNLLGIYINPDDIESDIRSDGFLNLSHYGIESDADEILEFFQSSSLLKKADLITKTFGLKFKDNKLIFNTVETNAYFASVASDFIRKKLLYSQKSFSFETVMSFEDKIDTLKLAQQLGFRTYLYYIATEDPEINISRVQYRYISGGHNVPKDKIESRYYRSLSLAHKAIFYANRAYFFDNSGSGSIWLAEINDGKKCILKTNTIPHWFQRSILSHLDNDHILNE